MRNLRLSVAMLAVFVSASLVVAGGASATVLCKANENPTCVGPKTWPSGTSFEIKRDPGGQMGFYFEATQVECNVSTAQMTIGAGTPLPVTITKLVFGECSNSCTVTARNLPWLGKISALGGGKGLVKMEPREGANPSVNITCGSVVCIYGNANLEFVIFGGGVGSASLFTMGLTKLTLEEPNKSCEGEVEWIGHYLIVATDGVYVV